MIPRIFLQKHDKIPSMDKKDLSMDKIFTHQNNPWMKKVLFIIDKSVTHGKNDELLFHPWMSSIDKKYQ